MRSQAQRRLDFGTGWRRALSPVLENRKGGGGVGEADGIFQGLTFCQGHREGPGEGVPGTHGVDRSDRWRGRFERFTRPRDHQGWGSSMSDEQGLKLKFVEELP